MQVYYSVIFNKGFGVLLFFDTFKSAKKYGESRLGEKWGQEIVTSFEIDRNITIYHHERIWASDENSQTD